MKMSIFIKKGDDGNFIKTKEYGPIAPFKANLRVSQNDQDIKPLDRSNSLVFDIP